MINIFNALTNADLLKATIMYQAMESVYEAAEDSVAMGVSDREYGETLGELLHFMERTAFYLAVTYSAEQAKDPDNRMIMKFDWWAWYNDTYAAFRDMHQDWEEKDALAQADRIYDLNKDINSHFPLFMKKFIGEGDELS